MPSKFCSQGSGVSTCGKMPGKKYVLTGFGDFLEQRTIEFVDPLPSSRICSACGSVPSRSVLLPCCHVLCLRCEGGTTAKAGCASWTGGAYAEADIVQLHFDKSHLERRRVRCLNVDKKCSFVGELYQLKEHLSGCIGEVAKCTKCGQGLAPPALAHHYQKCRSETGVNQSVSKLRSFVQAIEVILKLIEEFQGRSNNDRFDKGAMTGDIDCLVERMTNVQQEVLRVMLEGTSDVLGETVKPEMNKISASVPYRCASKPGFFVTLFKFAHVYDSYDKLQHEDEAAVFASTRVVGGYTLGPQCSLTRAEDGKVYASFLLFLRDGPWDGFVEWPFMKEVTVILTHPTNPGKDVKFSVTMNKYEFSMKPVPETWNCGIGTSDVEWMYIEQNGFISNGNLYIYIELQ